ncbi:MAG: ATP-dependent DNA helicase RecG [Lachnospiraceae bacterium]|nr:ATP-dependent DNA helicase RecG [Lachnospiraceae bacterium]
MKETDGIRVIKGIGEKSEKLFFKLGITSVTELLHYYPRIYDIFTGIVPVASVSEGETVVIEGSFTGKPAIIQTRQYKIIQAVLRDGSGSIRVAWFNMPFLLKTLKVGMHYILRGKIYVKNGTFQMTQPQILTKEEYVKWLGKLQPVYSLTAGLSNKAVTKAVTNAIHECEFESDFLPIEIRKQYGLLPLKKAISMIHFPDSKEDYAEARRRLVFDEFFLFSLALNYMREEKQEKPSEYFFPSTERTEQLLASLPFSLTEGQKSTWDDILSDLRSGFVMNRLIQGDVGSGKTIIAIIALFCAVENGYQGAIMVPTEVLARQHYEEFNRYLEPFGVKTVLLTGFMTASEKKEAKQLIKSGEADLVIGTHALIQDGVLFHDLALIVTDEQHRFGVKQREAFTEKGKNPHVLVMSATPIPRTLAIILYGDLDISVIDELPKNRLPIKNCAVGTNYRPQAYRFITKQVAEGHQVYIICPMIEESEAVEMENVMDYAGSLREILPESIRVECLHGKMKPAEKNKVMESFAAHEIDVLVSTTVVEVGINVPNATVMLIENAERFGLAQLHQLRGRVGRGTAQSYCIFMAGNSSRETMERLKVIARSNDGFFVAQEDLKMRGPGDLFGIRQSGEFYFRIGDIYQDAKELRDANEAAKSFTDRDVSLLCKKYQGLRKKLEKYAGEVSL